MRIETKQVITYKETYISDDGKVFPTEEACKNYEKKLEKENQKKILIEKAESFKITDLNDVVPINCDDPGQFNTFRWYKLSCLEDFKVLEAIYPYYLTAPDYYPTIICVENCSEEPYEDDAFSYELKDMKRDTVDFWRSLGYKVTFEKEI